MQNFNVKILQPKDQPLISGMQRQAAAPGPAPTDLPAYVSGHFPDFIARRYRTEGIAQGDLMWSTYLRENSIIDNTPVATLRG